MITRVLMIANVPVMGLIQGFLPIVGYNYGAQKPMRVRESVTLSIKAGTLIGIGLFVLVMLFPRQMLTIFTTDEVLVAQAADALRVVFFCHAAAYLATHRVSIFSGYRKGQTCITPGSGQTGVRSDPLILVLPIWFDQTEFGGLSPSRI